MTSRVIFSETSSPHIVCAYCFVEDVEVTVTLRPGEITVVLPSIPNQICRCSLTKLPLGQ